jgi:hypothetical protein
MSQVLISNLGRNSVPSEVSGSASHSRLLNAALSSAIARLP